MDSTARDASPLVALSAFRVRRGDHRLHRRFRDHCFDDARRVAKSASRRCHRRDSVRRRARDSQSVSRRRKNDDQSAQVDSGISLSQQSEHVLLQSGRQRPMETQENCPTCGRPRWSGLSDGAIDIEECEATGGVTCRLATQRNSLVSAMRRLAHANCDPATKRSCMAILEMIAPSSKSCPLCRETCVTRSGGSIVPHYPNKDSKTLCDASFGTLLGGVLFRRTP